MSDDIKKTVRAIWNLARKEGSLLELEAELRRIEAEAYNRGVEDAAKVCAVHAESFKSTSEGFMRSGHPEWSEHCNCPDCAPPKRKARAKRGAKR